MRGIFVLLLACCGRDMYPTTGAESGPCYRNLTCDAGLYCTQSNVCIDPEKQAGAPCLPSVCDSATMVRISDLPSGPYWVDVHEAHVVGGGDRGDDDQDFDKDGKIADPIAAAAHAVSHGLVYDDDGGEESVVRTTLVAHTEPYRQPQDGLTFYQAAAACANAGKRLCTSEEWIWACRGGAAARDFAYGDATDGGDDPGVDCWTSNMALSAQPTATASACVTPSGLWDMLGNVHELTGRVGDDVVLRGGSADSVAPHCGSSELVAMNDDSSDVGFRCCAQ